MAKRKWYVVIVGTIPGVYTTWTEVATKVAGVPGAIHQSFCTEEEARSAFERAQAAGEVRAVPANGPRRLPVPVINRGDEGSRSGSNSNSTRSTAHGSREIGRTRSEQSVASTGLPRMPRMNINNSERGRRREGGLQEPTQSAPPSPRTPTRTRAHTAVPISIRAPTFNPVQTWRGYVASPRPTTPRLPRPSSPEDIDMSISSSPETGVTQIEPLVLSPLLGHVAPVITSPRISVVTGPSYPDWPASDVDLTEHVGVSLRASPGKISRGEDIKESSSRRSSPSKKVTEWADSPSDLAEDDRFWIPGDYDMENVSVRRSSRQQSKGKGREMPIKVESCDELTYGQASTPGPARKKSLTLSASPHFRPLSREYPDNIFHRNSPPQTSTPADAPPPDAPPRSPSAALQYKFANEYAHAYATIYAQFATFGGPIGTGVLPTSISAPLGEFSARMHSSQLDRVDDLLASQGSPSGARSNVDHQPECSCSQSMSPFPGFSPLHVRPMSVDPQGDPRSPFSNKTPVPLPFPLPFSPPSVIGRPSPRCTLQMPCENLNLKV